MEQAIADASNEEFLYLSFCLTPESTISASRKGNLLLYLLSFNAFTPALLFLFLAAERRSYPWFTSSGEAIIDYSNTVLILLK
jgi:hypothetical protein